MSSKKWDVTETLHYVEIFAGETLESCICKIK